MPHNILIVFCTVLSGCTYIDIQGEGNTVDTYTEAPVMSNQVKYRDVEEEIKGDGG